MLVPATTVPVTIIGAFAGMAALGFTVNLSTLFAIVLAIGIVVDDAIVVVEGAAHHIERGMPGKDAAIQAMDELFGPIIGITLVLMSVFLPAAFIPGLTGKMFAQFALVIAATALLSAINAATLKPTQCALWLRPPVPPEQRNFFYRGFNAVYGRFENALCRPDRPHGGAQRPHVRRSRSSSSALAGLGPVADADRLPADRGPGLRARHRAIAGRRRRCSAPSGVLDRGQRDRRQGPRRRPGDRDLRRLRARQQLDAGQCRRRLYRAQGLEPARQGRGPALAVPDASTGSSPRSRTRASWCFRRRRSRASAMPAASPCRSQLRDGSFDLAKLQTITNAVVKDAQTQSGLQRVTSSFRSTVPQMKVEVDRAKAETLQVSIDDVFSTLAGLSRLELRRPVQQVRPHVPGLRAGGFAFRLRPEDIELLPVRNKQGSMIPLGTMVTITPGGGALAAEPLQSLPVLDDHGAAGRRASAPARRWTLMEQIAAEDAAAAARASNGPRCPTRRSSSATRSTTSSRWRCCWSTWCWPASTRAGSCRSR